VSWYVGYPFYHVRKFFAAIGTMLAEWWRRRIVRYLLQGLPALLMTIGVLAFGLVVYAQDRNLLANDYQLRGWQSLQEVRKAQAKGEEAPAQLAMAEMCFQRLLVLQNKDENRYLLAQALDVKKQPEAVIELIRTMAPPDKAGFGLAQLNMAELYLSGRIPPPPGSNAGVAAENHLVWAKQTKLSAPRANIMLAELYKRWNQDRKAVEKCLEEAAKAVPEWRGHQAKYYYETGRVEQARVYADVAAQVFQQRLDQYPGNHADRLSLAEVLVLKGDFAQAVATLRLGATLTQTNEQLHAGYCVQASKVYVAWYLSKAADARASTGEKLDLLEKALTWYPNNEAVYPLLLQLSRQPGPEAAKARQAVLDRTIGEKPSWMALLYLGMDAWSADNAADAKHYWEKAFELSDGTPLVANNLAWVIANYPPGSEDPPRALAMIDAAIKQLADKGLPPDPRFHGTRGHILAKIGRHEQALPELEKSMAAYPNDEKLFRQLAETCAKLNLPKVSEDYRRRADEIKQKKLPATARAVPGPDDKPAEPPKDSPAVPSQGPVDGESKLPVGAPGPDRPKSAPASTPPGGKAGTTPPPGKP
jgi:tetratricopeptide (TPR) repeat protein